MEIGLQSQQILSFEDIDRVQLTHLVTLPTEAL